MKVLNLYAGLGGNRKLWKNVDVTAVEINPVIAKIYQNFYPDDKVIVGDAFIYAGKNAEENARTLTDIYDIQVMSFKELKEKVKQP